MSKVLVEASEDEPKGQNDQNQIQSGRPLPNDFMNFYPWACGQFQTGVNVIINKMVQPEFFGTAVAVGRYQQAKKQRALRNPLNPLKAHVSVMKIESQRNMKYSSDNFTADPIVRINAICNYYDRLIHLNFVQSEIPIPRHMIIILKIIAKFHTHLISISFKRNVTSYVIYELSKLAEISTLTEVYLDDCYVREGNYIQLFDQKCALKVISLARCSLTDSIVSLIAEKLHYLQDGSKHLNVLNLSSNKITDVGAQNLALALRSNRKLYHLNLAGNLITDVGAFAILNTMVDFPISNEEQIAARGRRFKYLTDKVELVHDLIIKLTEEYVEKAIKRKAMKAMPPPRKRLSIYYPQIPVDDRGRIHDRANFLAENTLGEYDDPFYPLTTQNSVGYCFGNNILQSLNLAYNDLSILSVKKILKVMTYQLFLNRTPKGLININIEGNSLPLRCLEYYRINSIMEVMKDQDKTKRRRSQFN